MSFKLIMELTYIFEENTEWTFKIKIFFLVL